MVQDSQSDPSRASVVARQLILQDKVDMILTTSTPETTNPVAVACEKLGTPCLSTAVSYTHLGRSARTCTACTVPTTSRSPR